MSNKKKLSFNGNLRGSETTVFNEIPELPYLDKKIRFSLKHCNTDNFCITRLAKKEVERLYKRMGNFEDVTWRQVKQMPREHGFSLEKKEEANHKMLVSTYPIFDTFVHFRITGLDTPFRVFGAMKNDLCYVLIIDAKGQINH